jgi:hypothetical protein
VPEAGTLAAAVELMRQPLDMKSPRMVGACLSHVEGERIREVVTIANRHNAATAVDLLLRRIGCEEDTMSLTAAGLSRRDDGTATLKWLVAAGNDPVTVLTSEHGAMLMRTGETQAAARVCAGQVARHLATAGEAKA